MPVNIQISDANFSLGPETGFFYTFSNALNALLKVEADGTLVNTYPVSGALIRNPVKQLHYDGTFFWTLEDLPSDLGMVIKQWRLLPLPTVAFPALTPTEFRWQNEISLIHAPNIKWQADGFAVEHYHRFLNAPAAQGSSSIVLDDVTSLALGDKLYLGPSSFGGFEDTEETITVTSINTTSKVIGFTKSGGLVNSYTASDPVDFTKSIFIFNDNAFTGLYDGKGTLARFAWPRKNLILVDQKHIYADVTAADFDSTVLGWIKSSQIFELDLSSTPFAPFNSIEANLFEANQSDIITVYDLIYDYSSNLYYKLQQKETTESIGTGEFTTINFSPDYNFQTQTTLPIVNSISLSFPDGRHSLYFASGETLRVKAEVRDQFNFPVVGETIQFSAALNTLSEAGIVGTFSSSTVVTNVSGLAETIYTPSSTADVNLLIDITAKVL